MRFTEMLFGRKYGAFSGIILPYEFFMNIIAPILTAICILSYLVTAIFFFSILSVFLPLALIALTGVAVFLCLKMTSPATDFTLEKSDSKSRYGMIFSIIDLILMEFVLLFSLFSLIFRGPKYKWDKIENTRRLS